MTIRIKLGNELKKSLGHGKLSSLTPEQLHERITLGLKARDIPGVGVRAVSDVIGVSKSALSRHGSGEISPQRIGSKEKPPRIDPASEKYFLKAISMGSARGSNAISRDMLPGLIQDFSESLGTTTYCVAPTDNSRMERMRVRHPDTPPKAVKPKVKSKVKAASSNPAVVKAMFSFWEEWVINHSWRGQPGCGLGETGMPSCALAAWDEVQVCCKDGDVKIITCGNQTAEIRASGLHDFKLSLMLGVLTNGVCLPPFCLFDGTTWRTLSGRLSGVPTEWSFWCTPSGSMTNTSDDDTVGAMVKFAEHIVKHVRNYAGACVHEKETIAHLLDQHGSHFDSEANEILRNDFHELICNPSQTTHYLQIGDTKKLNGVFQLTRRKLIIELQRHIGTITRDNIMPTIVSSLYTAFNPTNIINAVKKVGFEYEKQNINKLVFGSQQINRAIVKHSSTYILSKRRQFSRTKRNHDLLDAQ